MSLFLNIQYFSDSIRSEPKYLPHNTFKSVLHNFTAFTVTNGNEEPLVMGFTVIYHLGVYLYKL
jgi:hypothetical protein